MATSETVSNHFLEDLENLQDDSLSPEKWAKTVCWFFYASVRKRYLNLQYLRIFFSKSGSVYLL